MLPSPSHLNGPVLRLLDYTVSARNPGEQPHIGVTSDHRENTVEGDKDHPSPFQGAEELPPLVTGWDSLARALRVLVLQLHMGQVGGYDHVGRLTRKVTWRLSEKQATGSEGAGSVCSRCKVGTCVHPQGKGRARHSNRKGNGPCIL